MTRTQGEKSLTLRTRVYTADAGWAGCRTATLRTLRPPLYRVDTQGRRPLRLMQENRRESAA